MAVKHIDIRYRRIADDTQGNSRYAVDWLELALVGESYEEFRERAKSMGLTPCRTTAVEFVWSSFNPEADIERWANQLLDPVILRDVHERVQQELAYTSLVVALVTARSHYANCGMGSPEFAYFRRAWYYTHQALEAYLYPTQQPTNHSQEGDTTTT